MKKWLFFIALVISCLCTNAKVYVGGTFGYSSQKSRSSGLTEKSLQYSITPEIGTRANDKTSLGIAFNANLSTNSDLNEMILMVLPYYRKVFAEVGSVKFFNELQLGIGSYILDGKSYSIWGASFGPGIMVDLSDKVQLIGRSIFIQYLNISDEFLSTNRSFYTNSTSLMSQTDISFNKGLEVGIIINL